MLPHYSALKVAEQFRVLEAIAPGPHRSRARPRAGLGRAHRACAQPERGDGGRSFPRPGARPHRLDRRSPAAGEPPVPRHPRRARRPGRARDLDARQLGLRRAGRRLFRPALLLRPFHHRRPRRRGGALALSRHLPPERAASRRRTRRSPSGRWRRRPRRRPSASTPRAPCGGSAAIAASMRRCPRRKRRCAFAAERGGARQDGTAARKRDHRHGRPGRARSCAPSPRRTRWTRSRS